MRLVLCEAGIVGLVLCEAGIVRLVLCEAGIVWGWYCVRLVLCIVPDRKEDLPLTSTHFCTACPIDAFVGEKNSECD